MALQTQSFNFDNTVKGLNAKDSPLRIGDEYVSDVRNMQLTITGAWTKRRGYERIGVNTNLGGTRSNMLFNYLGIPQQDGSQVSKVLAGTNGHVYNYVSGSDTFTDLGAIFTLNTTNDIRAVNFNGNAYLTNGVDYIVRYDGTNFYRAGLPSAPNIVSATTGATGITGNFRYCFTYGYTDVNSTIYEGEPCLPIAVTAANQAVTLTIPVIPASIGYDATNAKINIYRTENNGDTFYFVRQIPNTPAANTTYVDTLADTQLIANPVIYNQLNGGYTNLPFPVAQSIVVHNSSLFLGNITDLARGTIRFLNNTGLALMAVTIGAVTFTEGTNWAVGANVGVSAQNLANAINSSVTCGVYAYWLDNSDTIYLVDKAIRSTQLTFKVPVAYTASVILSTSTSGGGFVTGNMVAARYPSRVVYGYIGALEGFPEQNFADLDPNDGDYITGLGIVVDKIAIFKNNKIFTISGYDVSSYQPARCETNRGCVAGRTIQNIWGNILYLSREGVYMFDGVNPPTYISGIIERIFRDAHYLNFNLATSCDYKADNQYWLSIPNSSTTKNDLIVVFDYYLNAWTIFDNYDSEQLMVVLGEDKVYHATDTSLIYKELKSGGGTFEEQDPENYADDQDTYTAYIDTKEYDFDMPSAIKRYKRFTFQVDTISELDIQVYMYLNLDQAPADSTIISYEGSPWGIFAWGEDEWGGKPFNTGRWIIGDQKGRSARYRFQNSTVNQSFQVISWEIEIGVKANKGDDVTVSKTFKDKDL